MIGFQDLIIKQNIKTKDVAKQVGVTPGTICDWFNKNKVPEKYTKMISEIFNVQEEYLNKIVNNIITYEQKRKGFNNEYKIIGDTTEIYITRKKDNKNFTILIDSEDLPRLIKLDYRWYVNDQPSADWPYVCSTYYVTNKNGKKQGKVLKLHHFILGITNGDIVDHKNNKTLDNRKNNLRVVPHDKNTKNRKGKNSNNKSGYRNVSKRDNKWWVVQLQIEGKNTVLKKFPLDQLEEAGAYAELMRQEIYGEFAGKN